MADYSMDDEAWNKRTTKVRTYLDNNDLGDMEQEIEKGIGLQLLHFSECCPTPQFRVAARATYQPRYRKQLPQLLHNSRRRFLRLLRRTLFLVKSCASMERADMGLTTTRAITAIR